VLSVPSMLLVVRKTAAGLVVRISSGSLS